jgi:anti-sigma factor ChrR (cupin superfamily)
MSENSEELAGEFALGALEVEERVRVEHLMRNSPEFWRCVDLWSRRLMPLSDRTAPREPPASVWAALRRRIGDATPSHSRRQTEGVWLDIAPGVRLKMLHVDPVTGERTGLMWMEPGSSFPEHEHPETEECFVLEGVVNIDGQDYCAGDYTVADAGSRHDVIRSGLGGLLHLHWSALRAAP